MNGKSSVDVEDDDIPGGDVERGYQGSRVQMGKIDRNDKVDDEFQEVQEDQEGIRKKLETNYKKMLGIKQTPHWEDH